MEEPPQGENVEGIEKSIEKPSGQLAKERLAFVSGNILVFALLLLQLWPRMAKYQTHLHIHFWSMNLPGEGVKPELWIFWFVTLILAMMASALILAVFHIVCWGLWLGVSTEHGETQETNETRISIGLGKSLIHLCEISYGAVFFLSIFVVFMIVLTPLALLSVGIEQILVSGIGLSQKISGWIARGSISLILITFGAFSLIKIWKLLKLGYIDKLLHGHGAFTVYSFILSTVVLVPAWMIVIENCYTLDITINKKLFLQSRNEIVEIYIILGGATSSKNDAEVKLLDSKGSPLMELNPQRIGDGNYISYLATEKLSEGLYEVALEYPHISLDEKFPYISRNARISKWFIVLHQ